MIVFVILHYQKIEKTIKCVKSIKNKFDGKNKYKVLIVDNASPNCSGKFLKCRYEQDNKIKVFIEKENLGFAKGNNIGFEYAKKVLKPKYIILMNNDTMIINNNFFDELDNEYTRNKAAVIGPMLLSGDGKYTSNPMRRKPLTVNKIKNFLLDYRLRTFLLKIQIFGNLFEKIYSKLCILKRKFLKSKKLDNKISSIEYTKKAFNVVLHGSFMIFTPKYIEKFSGLYDKTFMYGEEDLLYFRCQKHNLKIEYDPNLIVYHEEKGSSSNERLQRKFFYKNASNSLEILLNYIEGE